jgi:hypothetical protein
MHSVDGSGIGTVDGHEHGAIERSRDGWFVSADAEWHSVRGQAQGSGKGCVIEMAVGTNVEVGSRLGKRLRSPPRNVEPLLVREAPTDIKLSHVDGPSAPIILDVLPGAATACDGEAPQVFLAGPVPKEPKHLGRLPVRQPFGFGDGGHKCLLA